MSAPPAPQPPVSAETETATTAPAAEPTAVTGPADPTDATDSVEPIYSSELTDSGQLTDSAEPTGSTNSAEPIHSSDSVGSGASPGPGIAPTPANVPVPAHAPAPVPVPAHARIPDHAPAPAHAPVSAHAPAPAHEPVPAHASAPVAASVPDRSLIAQPAGPIRTGWSVLPARIVALCIVELQKIRHDRSEIYTRAIQPVLWLAVFGETFTRIRAIPTGSVPYLDYLAPGIIAQSAMFIAIFYGIMIIWERDAGVLTKLLVTPTPRAALITGKAFASGTKALIQAIVVMIFAAILGVGMTANPLKILGVAALVVLGSAFFSCLSMSIAGIVLTRDRLMGIGQAITMPLFFSSNALYPTSVMPGWLQPISRINPLSYEVDGLRGLLIGTSAHIGLDFAILIGASVLSIWAAAALLPRLAK